MVVNRCRIENSHLIVIRVYHYFYLCHNYHYSVIVNFKRSTTNNAARLNVRLTIQLHIGHTPCQYCSLVRFIDMIIGMGGKCIILQL